MAPGLSAALVTALLAEGVGGVVLRVVPVSTPEIHESKLASLPMHLFQQDCSLVHRTVTKSKTRMPGAGMNPDNITSDVVLKDGYYQVDCVDDYMYYHGDKFGDNKVEYELGDVSNVSIVHYAAHVAKEDRQPMTHEVCFSFCRTVPDMNFFGILNGRDCYCTPYYQSVAGDDSMCDSVCEGNPTTMCGSKTKSSVFGMHMCANTGEDLAFAKGRMTDVESELSASLSTLSDAAKTMQDSAEFYQGHLGQNGDPAASDLMQTAKVEAGKLNETAGAAKKVEDDMGDYKGQEGAMGPSFTSVEDVSNAEALIRKMDKATSQGETAVDDMAEVLSANINSNGTENASKQYYSAMYFVDKKFVDSPSTCGGEAAATPMVGDLDGCARACDNAIHDCVGFSFFPAIGGSSKGLCFLMSSFKSLTYWKGCGQTGNFLQVKGGKGSPDPMEVRCMAKLSKFEGTTLKPDKSGKCKQCLKDLTGRDSCLISEGQ